MAVPVVLSFVWLVLMRYLTKFFVWLTIILLNVFVIGVTLFTYVKAGLIGSDAIGSDNVASLESASGAVSAGCWGSAHVVAIIHVHLVCSHEARGRKLSIRTKAGDPVVMLLRSIVEGPVNVEQRQLKSLLRFHNSTSIPSQAVS